MWDAQIAKNEQQHHTRAFRCRSTVTTVVCLKVPWVKCVTLLLMLILWELERISSDATIPDMP